MFINIYIYILSVVKRNSLFLHEIEWKNNGFLFTTPNIYYDMYLILKDNEITAFFASCSRGANILRRPFAHEYEIGNVG